MRLFPTQPPPAGRRPAGAEAPEGGRGGGKLGFRKIGFVHRHEMFKISCHLTAYFEGTLFVHRSKLFGDTPYKEYQLKLYLKAKVL